MTRAQYSPHLIETSDLPDYPLDEGTRLTAHYFTMFWHDRWLNSELHLTASLDVQACALNLIFLAQKQSPIGTLPDNDDILAKLLRVDLATWKDLRARPIHPLHNWHPCRCDDEIRLMHPVVTEVLLEALNRRDVREASNADKAVYQRLKRLRQAMAELGCDRAVIGDATLVERMDEWLLEHCKGQRRRAAYERALEHAASQKWFRSDR